MVPSYQKDISTDLLQAMEQMFSIGPNCILPVATAKVGHCHAPVEKDRVVLLRLFQYSRKYWMYCSCFCLDKVCTWST